MITLITGVPGSGKTALAVSMLLEVTGRPLFVQGIPELQLPHERTPPVADWTVRRPSPDDPQLEIPVFTFPSGSLVVIDEAQNVYRPRGVGSKVPDHVAAFEAHRHLGIDFWLITQSPTLIDANIRKLVSKHIHVRGSYLSRVIHEAPQVFNPDDRSERSLTAVRKYALPKKAFGLYKSAEVHTKVHTKLPLAVYVLGAVVAVGGGIAWYLSGRFEQLFGEGVDVAAELPTPQAAAGVRDIAPVSRAPVPVSMLEATTPTDPHNPLSAPLYAAVVPSVAAPEIQGCIASKRACACYSQQQTPVWLPDDQCRQRAAGLYYDPYRQRPMQPVPVETMPRTAEAAVAPMTEVQPAQASETPSATL